MKQKFKWKTRFILLILGILITQIGKTYAYLKPVHPLPKPISAFHKQPINFEEKLGIFKSKPFTGPNKVIWNGTITLKVSSFTQSKAKTVQLARQCGGNTYNERTWVTHSGRKYGKIMVRIPVKNRDQFTAQVQTLGKLYSENIAAPDLTSEFVDLGGRIRDLKAEEKQLLKILKRATNILQVLQVQSHLFSLQVEIEEMLSQRAQIAVKSQDAAFTIFLFEPKSTLYPVKPGGIEKFFPRWWKYKAEPILKSNLEQTYNFQSERFINYALGWNNSLPNFIFLIGFILILLILIKKVVPVYQQQIKETAQKIAEYGISPWKFFWSLIFLYGAHLFLPSLWSFILFLLFLGLWMSEILKTENGEKYIRKAEEWLQKKGIKTESVKFALFLFISGVFLSVIFPVFWEKLILLMLKTALFLFVLALIPGTALLIGHGIDRLKKVLSERAENI